MSHPCACERRRKATASKDQQIEYSLHQGMTTPVVDPRIDPYETANAHSNVVLLQLLNEILHYHYPERLAKALIVGEGWAKTEASHHATVLNSMDELSQYVDKDELGKLTGGLAEETLDNTTAVC